MPNNKKLSGSVMVYSLLILSVMTAVMLSVAQITMQNKKTGLSGRHSDAALQEADSGVEAFINEYKNKASRDPVSGLSGCNTTTGKITAGGSEIILVNNSGAQIDCDDSGASARIKDVKKIKSIGQDGQQNRAVESVPPCAGVEFDAGSVLLPSDSGLVGYWPLDNANQFNDLSGNNNSAVPMNLGVAPAPQIVANYKDINDPNAGKDAMVFNTYTGTKDGTNHNYAEIVNNAAYQTQFGTISFWFYSVNTDSESWIPFSKDANGCHKKGEIKGTDPNRYIDEDFDGVNDPDPEDPSYPSSGGECSDLTTDEDCDCGHLTIGYNYCSDDYCAIGKKGSITNVTTTSPTKSPTNDKILLRYQNDGNFGGYRLIKGGLVNGYADMNYSWHQATVTYSDKAYKFYVDGVLVDTFSGAKNDWNSYLYGSVYVGDVDGALEAQLNNIFRINLGRHTGSDLASAEFRTSLFKGGVRELRIYNRELSKCEVKRLYLDTQ